MTEDARFEEGGEAPLRLRALDGEDLKVIAALVQDAVFPGGQMQWDRRRRRFAILINRFRWEDREAAARRGRAFERVQAVLAVEDVMKVETQGVARKGDTVYSLLDVEWAPGEDGTGRLILTLAGDGAVALDVEALEVTLTDVTRPYAAPAGKAPHHGG